MLKVPFEQTVPHGSAKVFSLFVDGIAVAPGEPTDPVPGFVKEKSVIFGPAKCDGVTRAAEVKNGHLFALAFLREGTCGGGLGGGAGASVPQDFAGRCRSFAAGLLRVLSHRIFPCLVRLGRRTVSVE